jgi:hypothetical protein
MANKFQVTHPDGTVSKRGSKTRTYTHALQVSPVDPAAAAAHCELTARALEIKAERIREAAANPRFTIRDRRLGYSNPESRHSHELVLEGYRGAWCNAEGESMEGYPAVPLDAEQTRQKLIASAMSQADTHERYAAEQRKQAAAYLAGEAGTDWYVARWSMSQANAVKAAQSTEFDHLRVYGRKITVVEVEQG